MIRALGLVALALGSGHEPASFYFKLANTLPAYLQYQHEITYQNQLSRKKCSEATQISAAFHDDRSVRENQCFLKCNADPSAPGCAGYAAFCASINTGRGDPAALYPECFSASNIICVEMPQDLEDLCNAVNECDSYHFRQYGTGANTFYGGELNKMGCRQAANQLADNSNTALLAFRDQSLTKEECPLGLGVEVSGLAPGHELSAMRGLYAADLSLTMAGRTPQYYVHVHDANPNYISWHTSGCGWVGLMFDDQTVQTVVPDTCVDNDKLANLVLGQCNDMATCESDDPDYEVDLCELIVTVWGGSYCMNNIFAMICPVSCKVDCFMDNEEAAQQYGLMTGTFATTTGGPFCESLAADCADPVVKAVCPEAPQ
jgi:hypothetical protein